MKKVGFVEGRKADIFFENLPSMHQVKRMFLVFGVMHYFLISKIKADLTVVF